MYIFTIYTYIYIYTYQLLSIYLTPPPEADLAGASFWERSQHIPEEQCAAPDSWRLGGVSGGDVGLGHGRPSRWRNISRFDQARAGVSYKSIELKDEFIMQNPSINGWFGGTSISGNLHMRLSCRFSRTKTIQRGFDMVWQPTLHRESAVLKFGAEIHCIVVSDPVALKNPEFYISWLKTEATVSTFHTLWPDDQWLHLLSLRRHLELHFSPCSSCPWQPSRHVRPSF